MNIKNFPNQIIIFLKEAKLELKKVNWPTRQETMKYTLIVVSVSIAVAILLGGLDVIFNRLLEKMLNL